MWNRNKREDDIQVRPPSTAPGPADSVKEAIPMTAYPTRQSDFGSARAGAAIGKTLIVTGRIVGKEDLVIDGRLDGDVDLVENRLTIGPSGHVQGGVRAREIVVYGTVQGNLEASERVEIKKNAKVIGDLKAQRPVIEDEAYFKGNVETIRVETPKPAPRPAAAPPTQPPLGGEARLAAAAGEGRPEIKRG